MPTCESEAAFLLIAVYCTISRALRFAAIWGHPFGATAAASDYNRRPALQVLASRTIVALVRLHFYDDNLIMGKSAE